MEQNDIGRIAGKLVQFVEQEILEEEGVDCDANLLMELGVDSMGMLQLVGFIEAEYQLKISPVHFTIENFRSINVLSEFVGRLVNGNV